MLKPNVAHTTSGKWKSSPSLVFMRTIQAAGSFTDNISPGNTSIQMCLTSGGYIAASGFYCSFLNQADATLAVVFNQFGPNTLVGFIIPNPSPDIK